MTEITIFKNEQFGEIRTMIDENGDILFCLKDACAALLLDGKQVVRRLDKGVVSKHPLLTEGGAQLTTFVNEDGLYDVILDSRKREARAFRKWVTSEVLPQIRKTGGYIPTHQDGKELPAEEIVQRAFGIMQRTISHENLPADDCLSMTEVAKLFGLEAKDLISWLRDKRIIRRRGGRYVLTDHYAGLGYDSTRVFHAFSLDGRPKVHPYLVWTPQGAAFIKSLVERLK